MNQGEIEALRDRIAAKWPLSTHAFDSAVESRKMWARKPHKKVLEKMWYAGVLAPSMRHNFVKSYDLGERVFLPLPPDAPDEAAAGAALCELAMQRLWVASPARSENSGKRCRQPKLRHGPAARTLCQCASRAPTANGRRN